MLMVNQLASGQSAKNPEFYDMTAVAGPLETVINFHLYHTVLFRILSIISYKKFILETFS